jgi:acyl-CoA reductase-like NAD-dependent aldehyde dehydrogenase
VINGAALEKIHSYTQVGIDEGATLLTGGEIASDGDLGKGFFYRPTIFGDVEAGMRIAQEEIFGPTLSLIRVRDEAEAVRVSNGIAYGLSSSIFTSDVNRAFRAMRDLEAGITYINEGHRQRASRSGAGRAGRLHGVEVGLRRLLGNAPARADRQPVSVLGSHRKRGRIPRV